MTKQIVLFGCSLSACVIHSTGLGGSSNVNVTTYAASTGGAGGASGGQGSSAGSPAAPGAPADPGTDTSGTNEPPAPVVTDPNDMSAKTCIDADRPTTFIPADVDCVPGTRRELTVGTWTALGPPGIETASYGLLGVTIDPSNSDVLYVTVQDDGIWKTCDAGASWFQLGTPCGDNTVWDDQSNFLDVPFQVAVDPHDSTHLYATVGVRGEGDQGFWVSHNGGSSWERTPGFKTIASAHTFDVTEFSIDPTDFKHVILASHTGWSASGGGGILETKDGGDSWAARNPEPSWPTGTNSVAFLYDPTNNVGDANTWLEMTTGGFWRTTDAGDHWTSVAPNYFSIHGLDQIYRASSGILYAGASLYPVRSSDNGATWVQDMTGLPYADYCGIGGDGTHLFVAQAETNGNPHPAFFTSLETDGKAWTQYSTDTFFDGSMTIKYDATHHIVYSANYKAGVIALKTE